jgi:hypothetical protein
MAVTQRSPVINIEHLNEQLIASRLLFETAGRMSKMLDVFAVWLLAGSAALVGFLLSHHEFVVTKMTRWFLLIAAFGTVVQKYLATIVSAAAEGANLGRQVVEEHVARQGASGIPDLRVMVGYIRSALFPVGRWLASPYLEKALAGDLVAGASAMFRLGQIQGFIVVIDALLILVAIGAFLSP